jgi:tyrosine-protein kinase Etk/Wzc
LTNDEATTRDLPSAEDESDGIGILDLLIVLAERKWLILLSTFICGALATIMAFRTPPTFTATAVIMPPQQQSSSAAALLGQLGGIASMASQSFGYTNPKDLYIGLLSSRTVADGLIAKFSLQEVYKAKTLSAARKALAGRTTFVSDKSSLIKISVIDRDPKLAAKLANGYIDQYQELNSNLAITEASQRRLFFERQLENEKNKLIEAEAALKQTQEQKGLFQVSSQVDAMIRSMAQVRAEIAAREVNMQRLKAGATAQNPEVLRQEIELKALRNQLKSMEASDTQKSAGDPFLSTSMVPAAGLEYTRRLREVKYRETLFELLARQYEAARMDEAKESSIIQVIDPAIPPDRKSAPARRNYVIIGILLGGFLGILLAFLANAMKNLPDTPKMIVLKESLWTARGNTTPK